VDKRTISSAMPEDPVDHEYVLGRYERAIDYYWNAGKSNKRSYKLTRSITISLGALVTLISSLASADFIAKDVLLSTTFAIMTPLLAAILTIVGGLANSFHWGATWRDMILNAANLEKERDIFLATKPDERDVKTELAKMNDRVIDETDRFFRRVLDSEAAPDSD